MSNVVPLLSAANRKREQGDTAEAERLLRRVLTQSPGHAGAAKALGAMLIDAGRPADALAALSDAVKSRMGDVELNILLGRALFLTDQFVPAAQVLEQAVTIDPTSYAARLWLAKCLVSIGRAAQAEPLLRTLVSARPTDVLAVSALGRACIGLGRRREAITHFREAVRLSPSASTHSDLGYALYVAEQHDEALTQFDAAIAIDPRTVTAVAGKAMILVDRNAKVEARRLVHEALEAGLLNTVLANTHARLSTSPDQRPEARRVLERALARPAISPSERSSLLLSFGTLKEADADYDGAFACYREGNDLIDLRFNAAAQRQSSADILGAFDRATLDRLPRSTNRDPLPVFIIGMPRSGTSLVEQILDSHPSVHGAGELNDLGALAHNAPSLLNLTGSPPYPHYVRSLTQEHIDILARHYLDRLRQLGGSAARVTDKMPQNFLHLGLIDLLFPAAKVIHCIRHPLDTCLSCYTTSMNYSQSYKTRQRDLVEFYRSYRTVMDRLQETVRVPILHIRYEDMVADTPRHATQIVEFIDLPWDDRCLRFYENARVARTSSNDQVRRPIYNSSVGRWKHFERHLGELIDGLKDFSAAYEAR